MQTFFLWAQWTTSRSSSVGGLKIYRPLRSGPGYSSVLLDTLEATHAHKRAYQMPLKWSHISTITHFLLNQYGKKDTLSIKLIRQSKRMSRLSIKKGLSIIFDRKWRTLITIEQSNMKTVCKDVSSTSSCSQRLRARCTGGAWLKHKTLKSILLFNRATATDGGWHAST